MANRARFFSTTLPLRIVEFVHISRQFDDGLVNHFVHADIHAPGFIFNGAVVKRFFQLLVVMPQTYGNYLELEFHRVRPLLDFGRGDHVNVLILRAIVFSLSLIHI